MSHSDYLLTIAELAVTFAGLAAIVTVMRGPRRRAWSPREMVGLWGLLGPCLAVFLLAITPEPLVWAGSPPEWIWRGTSAVLAIGWFLGGGKAVLSLRRASAKGFPDPTPFSNPLLFALGSAVLVLATTNALGLFGAPNPARFALGLILSLGFSVVIFATFLSASTSRSSRQRRADAKTSVDAGGGI